MESDGIHKIFLDLDKSFDGFINAWEDLRDFAHNQNKLNNIKKENRLIKWLRKVVKV